MTSADVKALAAGAGGGQLSPHPTRKGPTMTVDMRARQAPLRARFGQHPGDAMVTDRAETWSAIDNPLHGVVVAGGGAIPFAVHWEVGGRHDGPVPGDLLCAALASCAESTLRIVASHHRLRLDAVRCIATGDVDVRGTLGVSRGVDISDFNRCSCRSNSPRRARRPPNGGDCCARSNTAAFFCKPCATV